VIFNGSLGVSLIVQPLQEIVQQWTEDGQGTPTCEATGTNLNEECFFSFHKTNMASSPPVNNVELKPLSEPTGTAKGRSTQHY
jgi:hypothetical protein